MIKTQTIPWDVAEHLETEEDMAAYLEAVLEENDPDLVAVARADIMRAKEMRQRVIDTELGRESLHLALSKSLAIEISKERLKQVSITITELFTIGKKQPELKSSNELLSNFIKKLTANDVSVTNLITV